MIESLIDKQDTFEIVRDQIAAILVLESANQQVLATAAGKDPNDWKLRIFLERANPWEQWLNDQNDKSPIVNIWFDTLGFDPKASNVMERQKGDGVFNIDCYGIGISADKPAGGHGPGDEAAAFASQKTYRLVRNILMAAQYTYLGLQGLVGGRWPQKGTAFQPQIDNRAMPQVTGMRLALEASFNEFSPQVVPERLEYIAIDVTDDQEAVLVKADYEFAPGELPDTGETPPAIATAAVIETLIDKQDTFEIVRDQIAAILKLESGIQQALAADAGKDPDDWKLRVFLERANPWEQWLNVQGDNVAALDKSPIVNVWFDNINYDRKASNIMERQKGDGVFNIDCYGFGVSSDNLAGGHNPGDEASALASQKACRLVRNILMAAQYTYLGLQGTVWGRWPQNITAFQAQLNNQAAQQVLGTRLALLSGFNEFSPQYVAETLSLISIDVTDDQEVVLLEADYLFPGFRVRVDSSGNVRVTQTADTRVTRELI